jgi:hypothetical protein
MPYRNKTYVCFDGDTDMHYYRLMQAWQQNDRSPFNFFNAHDLNRAYDDSMEESIKRQLRERLRNTKVFVVLIGARTRYLFKFVRWEMEQAIRLELPIIGVNLSGLRKQDPERCPPVIRDTLAVYISFNPAIMQHALETWPSDHAKFRSELRSGPFYYDETTYRSHGL